jgi:enoyl-CoA hydratase/carnithine racemase
MDHIQAERDGAVLTVRVTNEPYNFLTGAVTAELAGTLARAEHRRGVRAVVLAGGVPGVFLGHYDPEELLAGAEAGGMAVPVAAAPGPLRLVGALGRVPGAGRLLDRSPVAGIRSLLAFHGLVRRIQRSDKVYVAAIDGPALGGGLELALACDIRIMGDGGYRIGLVESTLGLVPGGGGSQLLARTLGAGRALELLLEGGLLAADEAVAAGLVHRAVPHEDVRREAAATALRLTRRAPGSVRALKQAVHEGGSRSLQRGLAMERARFLALASRRSTQETLRRYAEGVRAHREKTGGDAASFAADRVPAWLAENGGLL